MAQYQSFVKEEGFAPVDVPDVTPYINENLEALRRSEQKNVQDLYTRDKGRADEIAKSFQGISEISSKLGKFLEERELEYREKETAKIKAEEYQKYLANPEAYVDALFESNVEEVRELNKETEALGAKAYEQTGNHEVASQVRSLSGWREIRTAKIQLALANQFYESWLPKQLQGAEITDQASRGAAIELARQKFVKTFGLNGFGDDMLGSELYPGMMNIHAKIMKEGAAVDLQNDNFKEVAEVTSLFETDKDLASFVGSLSVTYDENGQVLGRKRGFDLAIGHFKKMMDAGTLTMDELDAIMAQEMPGMGGKTYGQMKPTAFENLKQELAAEERANNAARRADRLEETKVMVDEYVGKVADGLTPTKADIEALQAQVRQTTGEEDPRLNALLKDTASAQVEREADAMFENLYLAGQLTPEAVMRVPSVRLRQKWLKLATEQASNKSGKSKLHHKSLEELVKSTPGLKATPDGVRGQASVIIIGNLQGEYDRRVVELTNSAGPDANPDQIANQALAETVQLYNDAQAPGSSSIYNFNTREGKFSNYTSSQQQIASQDNKNVARNRLTNTTQLLQTIGERILDLPGAILTRAEFEQMDKDIARNGFKMPGIVTYVASQTGYTPLEVIKRAREAMDLPPMPQPPSLQYVDNTVSPKAKALLYKYQTPERSIRGFAETREYEPSIVPGGFGPKIKEAADANGIPPAVLTALLEQESGFRPDVISGKTLSRSGAAGIAQFMPGTAQQMGVNPLDTDSAIDGAARYLRHLMDSYGFDLKTAIYAYNAGPGTVQRYGVGATEENANYYPSIMKLATKYGYGQVSLNDPAIFRPSFASN
jgi:hypothetical protein